jgi:hypothetical protein
MESPDEYVHQLSQKLERQNFSVAYDGTAGDFHFDLVATKSEWELSKFGKMTRLIIVSTKNAIDKKAVQEYSSHATKYALEKGSSRPPRGMGGSVLSVPVIVSDDFPEDLKLWITESLMEKHWAAFEFPVLVSSTVRRIYYCKKTPVWGAAYYRGFRDFVEQELGFG